MHESPVAADTTLQHVVISENQVGMIRFYHEVFVYPPWPHVTLLIKEVFPCFLWTTHTECVIFSIRKRTNFESKRVLLKIRLLPLIANQYPPTQNYISNSYHWAVSQKITLTHNSSFITFLRRILELLTQNYFWKLAFDWLSEQMECRFRSAP